MPDHGRRTEAQCSALLLQAPTQVYIVARDAELRIESADCLNCQPSEGHVAPRYVLRNLIRKQDVYRPPRCVRHAIGNSSVTARGNIGTADPRVSRPQKRVG